ncbi:hypothetical protein KFE98_18105 [bacterium SCSIO 12741]|nr:hypothetical protein KFE98_18105 [bacterium SCSIO 12741]
MAANKIFLRFLLIGLWLICLSTAIAQESPLLRKVSVDFTYVRLEDALMEIAEKGRFKFSYQSNILDGDLLVSHQAQNQEVKTVLDALLRGNVRYKTTGNFVILHGEQKKAAEPVKSYRITGIIRDATTGKTISNVTVYDVNNLSNTLSEADGSYSLTTQGKRAETGIAFRKKDYLDTVIVVTPATSEELHLRLRPIIPLMPTKDTIQIPQKEVEDLGLVRMMVNDKQSTNTENMQKMETQPMQVTFVPGLSTNVNMSGAVSNNVSVNVLVGYAGGVSGVEIGGLLNIIRQDVNGWQVAGIGNIVGHHVNGVQFAGFFNTNLGCVNGLQISGFSNVLVDTLKGVQITGFSNVLGGKMAGSQISGFNNLTLHDATGLQVAGFSNVAIKKVDFFQIAGFSNYGREINGTQIAGFANISAHTVNGLQLAGGINFGENVLGAQGAGIMNLSVGDTASFQVAGVTNFCSHSDAGQVSAIANVAISSVNGVQISAVTNYTPVIKGFQYGLVNVAWDTVIGVQAGLTNCGGIVKGTQLGFININDSIHGVPLGFFTFSRRGYHKLSLELNELYPFNVQFRTGVSALHNVFQLGYTYRDGVSQVGAGYGLGTEGRLGRLFFLGGTAMAINNFTENIDDLDGTFRFQIYGGLKASKNLDFFVGPAINFHFTNQRDSEGNFYSSLPPYEHFSHLDPEFLLTGWVGLSAGMRFF